MAQIDETPFERVDLSLDDDSGFEAEVDEAVEEPDESEEPFEEEPQELDAESEEADEAEPEDSGEIEATQFKWSGNPNELPPPIEVDGVVYDLNETYRTMQGGYTKTMQNLAEQRKAAEALQKQMSEFLATQQQAQAKKDDPRPPMPTDDMTPDQQAQAWLDLQAWQTRETVRQMQENGAIPDPQKFNQTVAQQKQEAAFNRRISMLESQPDFGKYDQHIRDFLAAEEQNSQATGQGQYWLNQLQTSDEGAMALFNLVKNQVDASAAKSVAADAEAAKVKQKSGSRRRATPKPQAKRKAVDVFADEFKDMTPEQKIYAITEKTLGG